LAFTPGKLKGETSYFALPVCSRKGNQWVCTNSGCDVGKVRLEIMMIKCLKGVPDRLILNEEIYKIIEKMNKIDIKIIR
jgi:hypothetical protein